MMAGRELDAIVAEKVMGWRPWRSKHGYWNINIPNEGVISTYGRRNYSEQYDSQTGEKLPEIQWWEDCNELPNYSTAIEAAWKVVGRLDNWRGFDFRLRWCNNEWEAGWFEKLRNDPEPRATATADTPAVAICLAALKAVGAME